MDVRIEGVHVDFNPIIEYIRDLGYGARECKRANEFSISVFLKIKTDSTVSVEDVARNINRIVANTIEKVSKLERQGRVSMSVEIRWFENIISNCDSCGDGLREGYRLWIGDTPCPYYLCRECVDTLMYECAYALDA